MKRFQGFVVGVAAVALVAAFATPTLAGKTVISDEELDEVTAAGQPKIAQAYAANGTAFALNTQTYNIAAHVDGQEGLTALTLNNVFGENQVSNGVNIQAGEDNLGNQDNWAEQSWGASKAWWFAKDQAYAGGAGGAPTTDCAGALICKRHPGAAGAGTDIIVAVLWEFADEIAGAWSETTDATAKNEIQTDIEHEFAATAQTNLVALTVNNVVGLNQVANGLNITAGQLNGGTDITGASTSAVSNQTNQIDQYRGAPLGYLDVQVFSNCGTACIGPIGGVPGTQP